jgi:hypothetical protein
MTSKTVLILGSGEDEHAAHMLVHLRNRGCDVELFDSRWFPTQLEISLEPASGQGRIVLPSGRCLRLAQIQSVYWRAYHGIQEPPLPNPEQQWIAHNDTRGLLEALLMRLPARWVNGLDAFRLHQTKPAQLALVAELGAGVPATLVTNEPAAVKQFAQRHPRSIVKPVQGGDHAARLESRYLSDAHLSHLGLAPITVQEEVPGTNIRVFVAGHQALACEVSTSALDYRDDPAPRLNTHVLPPPIEQLALRISQTLHLLWTGIDFRLTPLGQYVFLEANPSPMFLGFEKQTGLPLTESLAALLTGEAAY